MAATGATLPTTRTHERPDWVQNLGGQALALVGALLIALLLGSVIIVLYGESPIAVYSAILDGSFGDVNGFGYVLANAGPLIFSALAVAVCFKGGMFNIGVEGQYIFAMAVASWAALTLTFLPGPLLIIVAVLFAMLGGMAWAAIPAILKVKTGAHEVVTTIMLNGIAASLVAWIIRGPLRYEKVGEWLRREPADRPVPRQRGDPGPRPLLRDPLQRPFLMGAADGVGDRGDRLVHPEADAPGV